MNDYPAIQNGPAHKNMDPINRIIDFERDPMILYAFGNFKHVCNHKHKLYLVSEISIHRKMGEN